MGITESLFSPVGFFFAELIFCGMMELAGQMTDPFGKDEVDFPLNTWLASALDETSVITEYPYGSTADGWSEVARKCPPLTMSPHFIKEVLVTEKAEAIISDTGCMPTGDS